jgi:hypothetical protein
MEESMIHFEIPYRDGNANKNDFPHQVELMLVLIKPFDHTKICFIDNHNHRVKDLQGDKWIDHDYYKSCFLISTKRNHNARQLLTMIKGDSAIIAFLNKTVTFLWVIFGWKMKSL